MAPRHLSFLSFCAANVLIDVESLYNLVHGNYPVHAFFHTYVGATLVVLFTCAAFALVRRITWIPNVLRWRDLRLGPVAAGAATGAYSHVVLDSIMHADMRPLMPLTHANHLLHAVPLGLLHMACVAAGMIGAVVILSRRMTG